MSRKIKLKARVDKLQQA